MLVGEGVTVAVPVPVAVGVCDGVNVGITVSVSNWPGVDGSVLVAVGVPDSNVAVGLSAGVKVATTPSTDGKAVGVTIGGGNVGIGPGDNT